MVAAAVLVLVLTGFYLSWRATRLDRLHHRVETARASLDAALLRRGAVALDLTSASQGLEPRPARELAAAATAARRAGAGEREPAESTLSRTLREVLEPLDPTEALRPHLTEVEHAAKGVCMARTFHNDAVADTQRARRSRLVRALRLAGTAPLPEFFEIDDRPPRIPFPPVKPDTL